LKWRPGGAILTGYLRSRAVMRGQVREGMTADRRALARLEAGMREVVTQRQWAWEDAEYEPERWFSTLRLVSSEISDEAATFIFADADGQKFGYRWRLRDEEGGWYAVVDLEEALTLFDANLMEDVDTTRPGDPDAEGVRWFGEDWTLRAL